ncbi:LicD family protein [Aequorivita sp. KMM 9714]|uniref:LicD family protein n=1 Tax=Aequorivita sp. KMM 9714 TaxID=2707173 RepID=UPI0013EC0162|nr:LicD family protein [Aequorivita sp. KMM 9714]NGX84740.1 LicD family protein [Aequorivita sp. KMM 9714]
MKLSIKELQALETEMLREVSEICERHNINYYLAYGSLLGAVRHKGPIPWDTDVDIAVPESQLPNFIKVVRAELSDKFYLNFYDVNKSYVNIYPRIGLRGYSTKLLHVDVYRIVGAPQDKKEQQEFKKKANYLSYILRYKNLKEGYFSFKEISLKEKLVVYLRAFFMLFVSKKSLLRKIENLCALYPFDTSETTVNISGGYGEKEFVSKKVYGKGVIVEFEGISIRVPENYKEYLEHFYGDYMQLPPKQEQKIKDYYCVFKSNFNKIKTFS